ncbi:Cu,Zn superoxide dismutase-like protein [Delitschia confertaspora ATCC 74209]|uniref:superoxide dismutase n=1 Tax=Delitschia confertaspora ATCC 74209 TaxID=1513339 RepID=A0A9P4MWJ1_9PLEO|nr:Cu,Zn superoxide dismutase-like protein [Delitschia confertaspora ATCC 74209]
MRSPIVAAVISTLALVQAQGSTVAPEVNTNPVGASFVATLPAKQGSALRGSVTAVSGANGKGVDFQVSLSGLPLSGGPFMYHIHEKPVPADGNCTGTGAHLDPYKRGETPPCNTAEKANCQVGDLSGKYGNINGTSYSTAYHDDWTSTNPLDKAYFGSLSVVVHLANKTRIGCANFSALAVPVPSSGTTASGYSNGSFPTATRTSTPNGGDTPSGTGLPQPPVQSPIGTGAASSVGVSLGGGAVLAGLMALIL